VDAIDQIVRLLIKILRHPSSREVTVAEFEKYLCKIEVRRSIPGNVLDILGELNYDLGFYVADPVMRAQDPSYFGDERLVEEVESTLELLSQAGVIVPREVRVRE